MTGAQIVRVPVAAIAFLTRVPVGRLIDIREEDVARSVILFPVVGGIVGGVAGLLADALAGPVPPLVAGALAVAAAALLTGAMHFDALADAADALGGKTRERSLEIMRDHAVGAFGTVAVVLVCVIDAAALGALGNENDAAVVGLAAGATARAAMLLPALVLPPARSGEGQGRMLAGLSSVAVVSAVGLAALLAIPAGWAGLWALAAGVAASVALLIYIRRWIGGVTGDLLGAVGKLAETCAVVAALIALS
jgi:adenosylcobinamide-GDP ribazoletransferase